MSEGARHARAVAAEHYRPELIKLLLVAEAPPAAPDRYFYFDHVATQDSLFRHVALGLLGRKPQRTEKREALEELRAHGVFLIDLQENPRDRTPLSAHVPDLVRRCERLAPERIVLIKTTVFDAARATLAAAGLPVSDVRVPFPGSGQQRRFLEAFAVATRGFA